MMLRANGEILDFNDLIEVEKQIKLFEEIDTTDGDFSYAFDLEKTLHNSQSLGNPFPDNILKPVYQKIPSQLLSENGAEIFNGYIRIEKITTVYQCSFFAGNNNWFGLLSDKLSALDWSQYDIDQSEANIVAAIDNTEGVVFPLVDNGGLVTRGNAQLKVEDFVAGIYTKTVFNKIFSSHGIKIRGELLNDVNFLSSITLSSGKSKDQIDASSTFASSTNGVARPGENIQYPIIFDNDSVYPYLDGSSDNYDATTGIYTFPFKMRVQIEVKLKPDIVDASYNNRIYLLINGVYTFVDIGLPAGGLYNSATAGTEDPFTFSRELVFQAGDQISFNTEWQQSVGSTQNDVISGTLKITPTFIYKAFGKDILPDWTQQEYVSNVIRLFNVLASYNTQNKILTLNLFEKIKDKPQLDLSEYISETEVDYSEFISSYGKKTLLSYKELEEQDFRPTRFAYAKGEIDVNNDFLDDSVDALESDFTNPISYINQAFDMSMERTNLLSYETSTSTGIDTAAVGDGVSDSAGIARFTILDDIFLVDDLVRITESTNPKYNGDWKVSAIGTGYVEFDGLLYDTDALVTLTRLTVSYTESGDVYFLFNVPSYDISKFSGLPVIRLENTDRSLFDIVFFNILNQGRQINKDFINSLSFSGSGPNHYQQTMIEQYFRLFSGVLNDPAKLYCTAHLPLAVYQRIDFLRPIRILTEETQNLYYLNRITGYKESYLPSTLELIKLSSKTVIPLEVIAPEPPVNLTPEYIQNANAFFSGGSTTNLTYTFSSGLSSSADNRVIGIFCCRTKVGNPETFITVNQGTIDSCVLIDSYGTSNLYLFQISGFPGGNTSLVLTWANAFNRPSDVNGSAFEIKHGHLSGTSSIGGSSSNSITQTMPVGLVPDPYSMIFCGAAFNAVPGFTDITTPPGVAQNPVSGNDANQSCFGAVIFPAGVGFPAQPIWDWANSVGSILAMYEVIYI